MSDLSDEIIDELEEEGKDELFKVAEQLLREQGAAVQTDEQKEAWAQNVLALLKGLPEEVPDMLGMSGGGSFRLDDETEAEAEREYEEERERLKKAGGVTQSTHQPAADEKPLSFSERFQQVLGKLMGASGE
jgi:hypothetical protein